MNKFLLSFIIVTLYVPSTWASPLEFTTYTCESMDNKKPYDIDQVEMKLEYSNDGETFFVRLAFDSFPDHHTYYRIDPSYHPKKNVEKTYYRLELKDVDGSPLPEGNIKSVLVEKCVIDGGGTPLPNDHFGGYLKLPAGGYGWAWYLCQR